jgi:hypothetical protein
MTWAEIMLITIRHAHRTRPGMLRAALIRAFDAETAHLTAKRRARVTATGDCKS